MKLQLLCALSLIMVLTACSTKESTPVPVTSLSGTFTGTFIKLHLSSKTKLIDTTTVSVQLNMETATGFKLTGDTSTVIAGSYGGYIVSSNNYMKFTDKTYPTSGTPVKFHLNGTFQYYYDGANFQLQAYGPLDTLSYAFNLKKISQ